MAVTTATTGSPPIVRIDRFPTLWELLEENARSHPRDVALVCGETRLLYPELKERVDRLAQALLARGIGRGQRVLWLAGNCHRILELLIAASRIGATLCVANWRSSPEELSRLFDDVDPSAVVWGNEDVTAGARDLGPSRDENRLWLTTDDYEQLIEGDAPTTEALLGEAEDPVLLIYTAAFEGRPNGALFSNVAIFVQDIVLAGMRGIDPRYCYLSCGPLFHYATLGPMLTTFHMGGKNVILGAADPEAICQAVERERCTGAFIVEPTLSKIVDLNRDGTYDLKSLRTTPGRPEWNAMVTVQEGPLGGYGLTEGGGVVTSAAFGGVGPWGGRPVSGMMVQIVGEDGVPVEPGEVGEMAIAGPALMSGYLERPELNARMLAGGWFRTGDSGRREDDGSVTFIGPIRRIIKSAFENIYPAEVEQCLRRHDGVADCAVIGIPDPVWKQRVKAIVVSKPGQTVSADELIEHCRGLMASYKKPSMVEFVDSLPRKGTAIDYDELDRSYGGGGYPGTT